MAGRKLEDLGAATRGVMNAILPPTHHLTQIVGSGGKAIISFGKLGSPLIWPCCHEPEVEYSRRF